MEFTLVADFKYWGWIQQSDEYLTTKKQGFVSLYEGPDHNAENVYYDLQLTKNKHVELPNK